MKQCVVERQTEVQYSEARRSDYRSVGTDGEGRQVWRGARPDEVGERRWFVLERPRRDTNGGSETEVTVTSKLQSKYRKKQGDRKETEKRREGSSPWGLRQRLDALSGGCAQPGAAESGGRRPECPV